MFDDERAEDSQQLLDSDGAAAEVAGESVEDVEAGAAAPTGRFSAEEAQRRKPRSVGPGSIALAPPPPGP